MTGGRSSSSECFSSRPENLILINCFVKSTIDFTHAKMEKDRTDGRIKSRIVLSIGVPEGILHAVQM